MPTPASYLGQLSLSFLYVQLILLRLTRNIHFGKKKKKNCQNDYKFYNKPHQDVCSGLFLLTFIFLHIVIVKCSKWATVHMHESFWNIQ